MICDNVIRERKHERIPGKELIETHRIALNKTYLLMLSNAK